MSDTHIIEQVRELVQSGMTQRAVAEALGLNKNQVSGICNRNHISREKTGRPRDYLRTLSAGEAPPTKTCQWPHGDPGEPGFHFCGDKAVLGKPYCEAHCLRAYRPPKEDA